MSSSGREDNANNGCDFDRIATVLGLRANQVRATTALLDEGNTVPFITRYRKECTGSLDEQQIRAIEAAVQSERQLRERQQAVLKSISAQGRLTNELQAAILAADTLKRIEDLYAPFRPKRRTRADAARERGLEPLADDVWFQRCDTQSLDQQSHALAQTHKDLPDQQAVLAGVSDILAERISDDADVRTHARSVAWSTGTLTVKAATNADQDAVQDFRDYADYSDSVKRIPPHRVLAMNRGENVGALRIRFTWDAERLNNFVDRRFRIANRACSAFLQDCAADAVRRILQPHLEREVRRELTETAEVHAVDVFARNLRSLLLQPPLSGERVVAIDPGLRTGCKLAALDESGVQLASDVIYLTGSDDRRAQAGERLTEFVRSYNCKLIAIGNGTACRETEQLVSDLIATGLPDVRYVIVNEAGASIYSTSEIAREEFPEFDALTRGTISIGRRLQDPLSELVKIEPRHIGVGMYQHDINPKRLQTSLDQVVESCVNYVGVDLNRASVSLLKYVSGLKQRTARNIVEWREQHGPFQTRRQLTDVPGIGDASFVQSAGFLRIRDGENPLDATWIHPENYEVTTRVLNSFGAQADDLHGTDEAAVQLRARLESIDCQARASEFNVGATTLADIVASLLRPGHDPRTEFHGPVFKGGILSLNDLAVGMELQGTILNVVDFGAFVDVGLKDSGLVHISKMSRTFVKSPHELVSVGDVVTVWVLDIDLERRRVSLSLLPPE